MDTIVEKTLELTSSYYQTHIVLTDKMSVVIKSVQTGTDKVARANDLSIFFS